MQTDIWYPDLHILGAPRCATTSMARYLGTHPMVDFSNPKETHYFATDLPRMRFISDAGSYDKLFTKQLQRPAIRAEGSVWYLYSREAVCNIMDVTPQAKFIVMLRSPIEVAYSLHAFHVVALHDDEADFATAFGLADRRRNGEGIPKTCPAADLIVYADNCRFGAMVERLFDTVPREQVLVLLYEDFVADTARLYQRVLRFAGLPDDGRREFPRVNEATVVKSTSLNRLDHLTRRLRMRATMPIKRCLGVEGIGLWRVMERFSREKAGRPPLDPRTHRMLVDCFAGDISRLSKLLGRDLSYWLAQRSPRLRASEPESLLSA